MSNAIATVLGGRIIEDGQLMARLIEMIPREKLGWRPDWPSASGAPAFTALELAVHIAQSFAAIPACLQKLHPEQLKHFNTQGFGGGPDSVSAAMEQTLERVEQGFALTTDADLSRTIPTYFSPQGEPFLEVIWANSKHLQHHTYQLFLYLKLMGLPVSTSDLHRFKT